MIAELRRETNFKWMSLTGSGLVSTDRLSFKGGYENRSRGGSIGVVFLWIYENAIMGDEDQVRKGVSGNICNSDFSRLPTTSTDRILEASSLKHLEI